MKKIITTIILLTFVILISFNVVSAYNLELVLSADKTDVKVGDEVTVYLTLSKGMQAADFTINYDSNLLEFKSTSLDNNFYTTKEPGKITCSWFDTNDTNKFTFTFTAKSTGIAKFTTTTENFYDGNLQSASSYNEGNLNITLLSSTNNLNINNSEKIDNLSNNSNIINNSENEQEKIEEKPVQTTNNTPNNTTLLTSSNSLPQTGNNSIVIITLIIAIVLIAIISRIKLNKLRDIY